MYPVFQRFLPACVALALLAGCGGAPRLESSAYTQVAEGALPPPSPADATASSRAYRIGPYDKLVVGVFGIEELSGKLQADGNGQILMPLIGTVDAAGKTPTELAQLIAGRLRGRFVRDPQVTVNLEEVVSQVITVDGQVSQPGLYPVVGDMTLMRAIATAKGLAEYARLDDVVIFRTVDGKRMAALYNLGAIRRGTYADPEVYANDVVVVGDSNARRLFKDLLTASPLLTTPLIYLLQ